MSGEEVGMKKLPGWPSGRFENPRISGLESSPRRPVWELNYFGFGNRSEFDLPRLPNSPTSGNLDPESNIV